VNKQAKFDTKVFTRFHFHFLQKSVTPTHIIVRPCCYRVSMTCLVDVLLYQVLTQWWHHLTVQLVGFLPDWEFHRVL